MSTTREKKWQTRDQETRIHQFPPRSLLAIPDCMTGDVLKSKQVIRFFITAMNNDDKYSLINGFLGDTGKTEKTN